MADGRQVRFSPTPPLRSAMRHSGHRRHDSGIGSSSSDYSGSSGNLDERFTAHSTACRSNDIDTVRTAYMDLWQDHELLQAACDEKENKIKDLNEYLQREFARLAEAEGRTKALVAELNAVKDHNRELKKEVDDFRTKYNDLYDVWKETKHSTDLARRSGTFIEPPHQLEQSKSLRDKNDDEMTSRMKDRINREPTAESSHASKSSHNSDGTLSTNRSSRRLSISANSKRPYKEKLPGDTSRRYPPNSSSVSGQRESGDYVPHPINLPDRSKRPH